MAGKDDYDGVSDSVVIKVVYRNREGMQQAYSASAIGVMAASLLFGEPFLDDEEDPERGLLFRAALRRRSFSRAKKRITSRW